MDKALKSHPETSNTCPHKDWQSAKYTQNVAKRLETKIVNTDKTRQDNIGSKETLPSHKCVNNENELFYSTNTLQEVKNETDFPAMYTHRVYTSDIPFNRQETKFVNSTFYR